MQPFRMMPRGLPCPHTIPEGMPISPTALWWKNCALGASEAVISFFPGSSHARNSWQLKRSHLEIWGKGSSPSHWWGGAYDCVIVCDSYLKEPCSHRMSVSPVKHAKNWWSCAWQNAPVMDELSEGAAFTMALSVMGLVTRTHQGSEVSKVKDGSTALHTSSPSLLRYSHLHLRYSPPSVNIVYVDLVMPSVVPPEGAPVLLMPLCGEDCRCQAFPSCTLLAMGSGKEAWMLPLLLYGWAPELRVWAGPCGAHQEGRVSPEEWWVGVWFKHHQQLSQA